jgi:hypothetical protein
MSFVSQYTRFVGVVIQLYFYMFYAQFFLIKVHRRDIKFRHRPQVDEEIYL